MKLARYLFTICLLLISTSTFAQINFVVNSSSDASDSDTADGNCDTGSQISPGVAECTLHAAIEQVNATPSAISNIVSFNIPTTDAGYNGGYWYLSDNLFNLLPDLTADNFHIDASTQPGSSCGNMATLGNHDLKIVWQGQASFFHLKGNTDQSVRGFETTESFNVSGSGSKEISCNSRTGSNFPTSIFVFNFTGDLEISNNRDLEVNISGNSLNTIFIFGNKFTNVNQGVSVSSTDGVSIGKDAAGNIIANLFRSSLGSDIQVFNSDNHEIVGNTFEGDAAQIELNTSHDNYIAENLFAGVAHFLFPVVYLKKSDRNTIVENTFAAPGGTGWAHLLLTEGSDDNIIGQFQKGNIFQNLAGPDPPIQVGTSVSDLNSGNQIRYNILANNIDQGIDLAPIGRNINDPGDADTGPNKLQNYPDLLTADALVNSPGAAMTISYEIDSAPANSTYPITVHFYLADSDNEDAETYIGQDIYTVGDYNSPLLGSKVATFTTNEVLVATSYISATATDAEGNTSEISDPIPLDSFLPVELANFEGQIDDDRLYLNWTTLTEDNNAGFEIELRQKGLSSWDVLGFVGGAGSSDIEQDYAFEQQISPGHYFVRLKQLDFDGTFAYSPSILIESEIPVGGILSESYPNPSRGISQFTYTSSGMETIGRLFDLQGSEIMTVFNSSDETGVSRSHQLDLTDLPSGVYFLNVTNASSTVTRKINLLR